MCAPEAPSDDKDEGFVDEDEVEMVDSDDVDQEDAEAVSIEFISDSQVLFNVELTSRRR